MNEVPKPIRSGGELQRRAYSDEETIQLYELGRWYFENGDLRGAETIAAGLCEIAPSFIPAWLLLTCVQLLNQSFESAATSASHILTLDRNSAAAQLLSVVSMLNLGDFHAAGSLLGEIGERIQSSQIQDPLLVKFYQIQMGRYRHHVG